MKRLSARKVKDGWIVEITETHHLYSRSDVFMLIKQNGMECIKPEKRGFILAE